MRKFVFSKPPSRNFKNPDHPQSDFGLIRKLITTDINIISILFFPIIIITRPKPPSGRQGLAGSWGKDTVRQVHYKMFSTSHFAPTALSSNWILLFKCGYKNSLVITKIFYFLLSTFYFLSEDKPLQTNKQTDRPFKKVIIFRYRQTHTSS